MNKEYIAPDMELIRFTMADTLLTVSRTEDDLTTVIDNPELPPEDPDNEWDL